MKSFEREAIETAAEAATEAHLGQFRKDGKTPYIVHPERVATCVMKFGGDHISIISAWLHDVIEDCQNGNQILYDSLMKTGLPERERNDIFAIVSALTKNDAIHGKSERLADSLKRINQAPHQAILVKLCDRMDNLMDALDQDQEFLSEYLSMTDLLIDSLSEGARQHGYTQALEQLESDRAEAGFL